MFELHGGRIQISFSSDHSDALLFSGVWLSVLRGSSQAALSEQYQRYSIIPVKNLLLALQTRR